MKENSEKRPVPAHEEGHGSVEDTPENRAWIGETEPQPVKDRGSK